MNIDDNEYWDVESNVGSEVGRGDNVGVDSDVGAKVGSGDGVGFELEFGDEFGSLYDSGANKGVKCVVSVGVDESVVWGVDRDVGAGIGSADRITFGIDDGSDMVSSGGFFDGFNVGNHVG